MKRILSGALLMTLVAFVAGAQETSPLKTEKDKVSYSIGMVFGKSLKQQGIDFDSALLLKGIQDATAGAKALMTDEEIKTLLTEYKMKLATELSEKNKKDGEAFLAENKKKEGVITLPSGLQYKVLKEGTGPKPLATDTVKTHYKGTFIDGTEFDSSYGRGEPAEFPVNGVIPGWTEALQLMSVGSKWQVVIPANLAYGEKGAGNGVIPANSTLVFEVELMEIVPPTQTAPSEEAPHE